MEAIGIEKRGLLKSARDLTAKCQSLERKLTESESRVGFLKCQICHLFNPSCCS
jgi:hypothetical protein